VIICGAHSFFCIYQLWCLDVSDILKNHT